MPLEEQPQQPPPEARVLADGPSDGVTALRYLPKQSSHLASTSWDGSVRLHQIGDNNNNENNNKALLSQSMGSGPLLSLATPQGMDAVVTGGLDGSVKLLDIPTTTITQVGAHVASAADKVGVSCLHALHGDHANLVASAGWHKQFHLWDIRQSSTTSAVCTLDLPGKAFGMDYDPDHQRLVVATAGRRTCLIDIRSPTSAEISLDRESSLKFQTRCISFFPGGNSFALGSVEGRVGVEFLEELGLAGGKKYAFKCHRVNDTVYPVNCLAFHPKFHGTFATGGCDGTVVLWDGLHKKKLTSLPAFPTSISAMAFNHDGSQMAIAASYTYEEGDREHPRDEIYIRPMLDSECMPKTK